MREAFMNIAMGKVATSAHEAYDMGILQKSQRHCGSKQNRQIAGRKK